MFTRNPSTGEKVLFGEYISGAKGEDLVSGRRTPQPVSALKEQMPDMYGQLEEVAGILENHFRDMQDVEFTIESGKMYILQTRSGKRSGQASVKIAVDMVNEGLITKEEGFLRVTPKQVDAMLHPQFSEEEKKKARKEGRFYATGVNASPGAAVGLIYFDADTAERMAKEQKQDVIMVRPFTKPDDVHGI